MDGLSNVTVYPIPTYASSSENPSILNITTVARQMIEIYKDEIIARGFLTKTEYVEGVNKLKQMAAETRCVLAGPHKIMTVAGDKKSLKSKGILPSEDRIQALTKKQLVNRNSSTGNFVQICSMH